MDNENYQNAVEFVGEPVIIPNDNERAIGRAKAVKILAEYSLALALIMFGGFLNQTYIMCLGLAGIMFTPVINDNNKNKHLLHPFTKFMFLLIGSALIVMAFIMLVVRK